jgi:hypothetical protein
LDHHDLGDDLHPLVKIDNVLVAHTDAARGRIGADGPRLVRAVDAIIARAEIKLSIAGGDERVELFEFSQACG